MDALRSPGATLSSADYLAASIGDWGGARFLLAVLALLNSKNVVDLSSGQRGRNAKPGKKPLLSYTICKINMRRRLGTEGDHLSSSGACRAHFVRGHFKMRRSGVYWWSPFIRGDKSLGFVSKSYRAVGP
jgi:hypothetical protein